MSPSRGNWHWTKEQDIALARRRMVDGWQFKRIAHEFGRSEPTVLKRFHDLRDKLETAHSDVLRRHREEELALLDKLLIEEGKTDRGELE